MNKIINKSALRIAVFFFIIYWPIIFIGGLFGQAMTWGNNDGNIFSKIGMLVLKYFYLIPSAGLIMNSLISTFLTYLIALGIIKFRSVRKIKQ